MRKISILIVTLLIVTYAGYGKDLSISLYGYSMPPSDSVYKDLYGSAFYPEFRVETGPFIYKKKVSLWGSLGYLASSGEVPGLDEGIKSSQFFIALGGGYKRGLSFLMKPLAANVKLGLVYFNFKEDVVDMVVSDSALGFIGSLGLTYDIDKRFFVGFEFGFLSGSGTIAPVDESSQQVSVKLGGIKFGVGVGMKL
jgi:hypothetical protein